MPLGVGGEIGRYDEKPRAKGHCCLIHKGSSFLLPSPNKTLAQGVHKPFVCFFLEFEQPLFGVVRAKVQLVTAAYFCQRDFTKFELLESLFAGLNQTLSGPVDYETLHLGEVLTLKAFSFCFKLTFLASGVSRNVPSFFGAEI